RVGPGAGGTEQADALADRDLRRAAGAGAEDDRVGAVAVQVAEGHEGAAAQGRVEGEEIVEGVLVAALQEGGAVPAGDARAAAVAGGDDDVELAVAVDVTGGGAGAAAESGVGDTEEV